MANYNLTKRNLLKQRAFGNLLGVPLDGHREKKGWVPISPCICVKADDCPCDTLDDIIVWIPSNIRYRKTGIRCRGDQVLAYDVSTDAVVMVEAQLPMTIGQLQQAKRLAESGARHRRVVFDSSIDGDGKTSIGALIVKAFELGWSIGEKIDGQTGLTDKLSDWLAEKFSKPGRAPRPKATVQVEAGTKPS